MGQAHRFSGVGGPYEGLTTIRRGKVDWTGSVRLVPEMLSKPLHWRKPRRVFVNSMSDLFHESLAFEEIAAVFNVMAACPQHLFQILTKRPDQAAEWFRWMSEADPDWTCPLQTQKLGRFGLKLRSKGIEWPLPNVHLGVSAEHQDTFNERAFRLEQCPVAVRWVSLEPLLEPIRLRTARSYLNWIVVGGESGPGARQCAVEWIESIVEQCRDAAIPCFVKQLGSNYADGRLVRRLQHSKGGDPDEWPEHLRIREFPRVEVW